MKQDISGAKHFHEALAATPRDLRQQMEWSFHIADEIDDALDAKDYIQNTASHPIQKAAGIGIHDFPQHKMLIERMCR